MPASAAIAKPYNPAAPDWVGQPDVPEFVPQNYSVTPSLKPVSINLGLVSFLTLCFLPSQTFPIIKKSAFMSPWFLDPINTKTGKTRLHLEICQWRGILEVSVNSSYLVNAWLRSPHRKWPSRPFRQAIH